MFAKNIPVLYNINATPCITASHQAVIVRRMRKLRANSSLLKS